MLQLGLRLHDGEKLPIKEKYRKAMDVLYGQILRQPRTYEGSFWHKAIYPNQVWLDGLYRHGYDAGKTAFWAGEDGSYEYYISEPVVENDAKGLAPFLMCYTELLLSRPQGLTL